MVTHRGIEVSPNQIRAIKEVFYPEWLANIVVVKKNNRKWQVYVDFIDLNKPARKIRSLCLR